ncbi:hypothetical protein M432DRAFT_427413 [Thermoascus aurantiacus ATCC 26904]
MYFFFSADILKVSKSFSVTSVLRLSSVHMTILLFSLFPFFMCFYHDSPLFPLTPYSVSICEQRKASCFLVSSTYPTYTTNSCILVCFGLRVCGLFWDRAQAWGI